MKAIPTLSILAALAGPAVAAVDAQPYADPTLGYTVMVPKGWAIAPGMLMAATSPLEGPQDRFQETIKVVAADLAPGVSLETYVRNSLDAWKAIWKVRERRSVTVGGAPAHRLVIDQTVGRAQTRLLKSFVAHGGKVYVITCAAEPARFADHLPRFEHALAHFAFTPVQAPAGPQALVVAGGRLMVGAAWKRTVPTMFTAQLGDRRATVTASVGPGTVPFALEGVRSLYRDGELGRIVTDGPATLGGQPAHRLVIVDGQGEGGDTRVRYFAGKAGRVAEVTFLIDSADALSPAVAAECEAIAASWRWD